jgi:hypothetical protein
VSSRCNGNRIVTHACFVGSAMVTLIRRFLSSMLLRLNEAFAETYRNSKLARQVCTVKCQTYLLFKVNKRPPLREASIIKNHPNSFDRAILRFSYQRRSNRHYDRLTGSNIFLKSCSFTNLLNPATYTSFSLFLASVLSFFLSGSEIAT